MKETWKPIPDYDGLYEASSLGRIRSAPNKTTSNVRCDRRVWKTRILKTKYPHKQKRQDERVCLWKDGEEHTYLVSRLVASAWHGKPKDTKLTVNHKNGNWRDNRPENLEWVTIRENIHHAVENGYFGSFSHRVELCSGNEEHLEFRSKSSASEFLGRNHGYISGVMKKGRDDVYAEDGKKYQVREV